MIKVILREDVAGLGKSGDAKQVKDGYARNFLLPKNLALLATEHGLKQIEAVQKKRDARIISDRKKSEELAKKLDNFSLTIAVEVNEEEKLYGSLTATDLAKAISAEGIEINKKDILLDAPIKGLGIYDVAIKLHSELTAKIKVWVVKK